jgi:hypothetical protein
MMFGKPHGIVAGLIHHLCPFQGSLVDCFKGHAAFWPAKKEEHTEFHRRPFSRFSPSGRKGNAGEGRLFK